MTNKGFSSKKKGFSLVLVILIFAGIGIITIGAVIFSAKIKTISVERTTLKRMLVIRDAAKKYFRNQEALAAPGVGEQDVPVSAQFLNLEQDYRQDAWGQALVYYVPPAGAGQISGVTVNGKTVAGYILSLGQNQTRESNLAVGPAINQAGDDVLVPVNVQPEAIEIVLEETTALSKKNCAYRIRNGYWQTNAATLAGDYGLGVTYGLDPWQKPYQALISAGGGHSCHFYSYGPDMIALNSDDVAGPPATDTHCVFTPPAPLHDPFDNLNNWTDLRGTHAINTFAGGNALNVTGTVPVGNPFLRESLLGLDWQTATEDLDEAWVRAGNFLSYDAQLKAAKSFSVLDHFMGGISFRLDTSDNDLSYGVSFLKSTTPGLDGIPNQFVPPGMNDNYMIILWERTGTTAANRKWLAYKELPDPYRTYFSDDMEGGAGNWTATGGWSWSTDNPHSGSRCWYTGSVNNADYYLTSNAISLP
ncbi:MAG: hypothetical protein SV487_10380, partial [Thermodesulfobacteriota bacterium]|nr:hypothetical protein [Thermodesulfobacteriota bacterium]